MRYAREDKELELSDEEAAFLAGVMSVQGAFNRTGGTAKRTGWIVGSKTSPQTIARVAELTGEPLRLVKRGNIVVVAGQKLTELMEIVSEWLDPDRYEQYLTALETTDAKVKANREKHLKAVAEREARVQEMRLMTKERRRKLAEATYRNQDPAIQVVDDPGVAEAEVVRAIAKRRAQEGMMKDQMRRYN